MDRISNINNIIEILRNKVTPEKAGHLHKKSSTNKNSKTKNLHFKNELSNLESLIINRIDKLSSDDENYQDKAKRIFIESVLTREFGEKLADDQDFTDIVIDINNQITNNNVLNKKLNKLLKLLTSGAQ